MSSTDLPLTDRARQALVLAEREARRWRHEYLGTEHVLLGILRLQSGLAHALLRALKVDLANLSREVEKLVPPGREPSPSEIPRTPRTKRAFALAGEEARALGHNYIGSEYLLLGLIREGEGVAAQVLMNMGLRLDLVRSELLQLLGPQHNAIGSPHPSKASSNPYEAPLTPSTAPSARPPFTRIGWPTFAGSMLGLFIGCVVATHPALSANPAIATVTIFLMTGATALGLHALVRWLRIDVP